MPSIWPLLAQLQPALSWLVWAPLFLHSDLKPVALAARRGWELSSSPPVPPAAVAASWEKGKKKKKKSWAAVAGKSLLSHLPAPLSLPSPRQVRTRQRWRPGPAARTLGACSGHRPPGREPSGCFLSPSQSRAPRRDASPLRGPEKAKA